MAQYGIVDQKRVCVVAGVKRMGQLAQSGGNPVRRQLDRRGLDPPGKFQQLAQRDLLMFLIQPGQVLQTRLQIDREARAGGLAQHAADPYPCVSILDVVHWIVIKRHRRVQDRQACDRRYSRRGSFCAASGCHRG